MEKKPVTSTNGKICYIEIPAIDMVSSASFYQAVFNWNIRKRSDGTISFDDSTGQVSGAWAPDRKPATEPEILIHIMVDDIEDAIRLVIANGGKIVQPVGMQLPEITARFSDPAGNIFGLYQEPVN